MSTKLVTFLALVQEQYMALGFTKEAAFSKVYLESGVSRGSIRAAYNGTRVTPETAGDLLVWSRAIHKREVDVGALMSAPPRQRRKAGTLLGRLTLLDVGVTETAGVLSVRVHAPDNDVLPSDLFAALEEHMRTLRPAGGV